jgi:hypothetical protein
MHFSTWLWEQMDESTPIGDFANLCWKDVNNGCAHAKFNAMNWLTHFEERHPENKNKLTSILALAFKAYILSLPKK